MRDSRVRVAFRIVSNLPVPVLLRTSFIDRFAKGIFPLQGKLVPCSSKPALILAINDPSEEHETKDDKAQDLMTTKGKCALHLVRVARQTKNQSRSEGVIFVATDGKGLVMKGLLLGRDSSPAWTIDTAIID